MDTPTIKPKGNFGKGALNFFLFVCAAFLGGLLASFCVRYASKDISGKVVGTATPCLNIGKDPGSTANDMPSEE